MWPPSKRAALPRSQALRPWRCCQHCSARQPAEDVKFSFERYRGAASKALKERVTAVEVVSPTRVSFRLKPPWPDFLTLYSSATGAGWIVPKAYVTRVGDEGLKKRPIGAGPHRFVSFSLSALRALRGGEARGLCHRAPGGGGGRPSRDVTSR
jgi:hypothetical protein